MINAYQLSRRGLQHIFDSIIEGGLDSNVYRHLNLSVLLTQSPDQDLGAVST